MNKVRKFLILSAVLFLCVIGAAAQTTTLSATVTDSTSTVWVGGSYTLQFIPNPAQPNVNIYNINGVPITTYCALSYNGTLNNSGQFSQAVCNNSLITPTGSQWQVTVCPLAQSKCGNITLPVSGSSMSVSSQLTATIPVPSFNAIAGAYGYNDAEAILTLPIGATYWNVSNSCQRYNNGSSWACVGSGGGLPVGCTSPATGSIDCTGYLAGDGVYDEGSTVLVADEPLGRWTIGSDMCATISNAINYAVGQGWLSATIDARRKEWVGQQSCAHWLFNGYSGVPEGFTGTLLLQGSDISIAATSAPSGCGPTGANTCLGVVPGGWVVDGANNHADNNNATAAYPGTIIRPASQVSGFVIVSLGSTNDPDAPTGASLRNITVSCVPDSGTYVNGSENIGIQNANTQQWANQNNLTVDGCGAAGVDVEESPATQTGVHTNTNEGGGSDITVNMPADTTGPQQPVGYEFGGFTTGTGATLTATCSGGTITGVSGSGGTGWLAPAWVSLTNSTGTIISAVPNASGVLQYTLVAGGTCTGTPVATVYPMGLNTFGGINGIGLWKNLTAQIPPQTCTGCSASNSQSGVGIGADIQGSRISINNFFAQFLSTDVRVGTINTARHNNISLVSNVNNAQASQDYMVKTGTGSGDLIINNLYSGGGGSFSTASAYSASGSTLTVTMPNNVDCTLTPSFMFTATSGDALFPLNGLQIPVRSTGCTSSQLQFATNLITGSGSTAAVIQTGDVLYDQLYPTGPCTLQNAGDFLTSYIRPGTHGNSGVAISGSTGQCATFFPGVAYTTQSNNFGNFNQYFNSNNIILPSGSTAGTNFGANGAFELWAWCGVVGTCPGTLGDLVNGGLSLAFTSGGLAEMSLSGPGPGTTGWTINSQFSFDNFNNIYAGIAGLDTNWHFNAPIQMQLNNASTFHATFAFPSGDFTNGRSIYIPDANSTLVVPSTAAGGNCLNGISALGVFSTTACGGSGSGVSSINSTTGAFTFGGSGVSCTGTTCTFSGTGSGVSSFSAGNLSPLFTTSVATPTTTPALSFALSSTSQNFFLAGPTSGSGSPTYRAMVSADIPNNAANTSGSAGSTIAAITFNNAGAGAGSGTTFNGSTTQTISYNTIGAQPALTLIKGTYVDGDYCTYVASGTLLNCNSTPGGSVSSVANSDGTLIISPTTGAVVGSLNLNHANTWTANQTSANWIASTGFDISGATTAGHYLRNNGTDYVDNTIQSSDVPTLNQSTTGNAATSSALAATPSQCTGSMFSTGIAANGNANCSTPSGSGGSALSGITAATTSNTIANGNNGAQVWNWAQTTNSQTAFQLGETTAATGTGDIEHGIVTLAGSTAIPLSVTQSQTGSQALPGISLTPTINSSGAGQGFFENYTCTSCASYLPIQLEKGGTSQFKVDSSGDGTFAGTLTIASGVTLGGLSTVPNLFEVSHNFTTGSGNQAFLFETANLNSIGTGSTVDILGISNAIFGSSSTTYTSGASWNALQLNPTFGAATTTIYNGTLPMTVTQSTPTVDVSTSSTGHYSEWYSKPVETSVGTATNYLIEHYASGGSTIAFGVREDGGQLIGSPQTSVSCSTSGTAVFSQPEQGASNKKVLIHLAACLGTASYTYPTAFTNSPSCYASSLIACTVAGTISSTAVTVTGATSTGSLVLEDY